MGTTYDQIEEFLKAENLKYQRRKRDDSEHIALAYTTRQYLNSAKEKGITLVIRLLEEGGYFEVAAPGAYSCPTDSPHLLPVLQTILMVSWRTKIVQFEYDAKDGEIRPIIELPLEDALLTQRQMARCISSLLSLIEEYHPVIATALEHGRIEIKDRSLPAFDLISQVVQSLEGKSPEELQAILASLRAGGTGVTTPPGAGPVPTAL